MNVKLWQLCCSSGKMNAITVGTRWSISASGHTLPTSAWVTDVWGHHWWEQLLRPQRLNAAVLWKGMNVSAEIAAQQLTCTLLMCQSSELKYGLVMVNIGLEHHVNGYDKNKHFYLKCFFFIGLFFLIAFLTLFLPLKITHKIRMYTITFFILSSEIAGSIISLITLLDMMHQNVSFTGIHWIEHRVSQWIHNWQLCPLHLQQWMTVSRYFFFFFLLAVPFFFF